MLKISLDKITVVLATIIFIFNIPPFFLWNIPVIFYWTLLFSFWLVAFTRCKKINKNEIIVIFIFIFIFILNSISLYDISRPNILTLISISIIIALPLCVKRNVFKSIVYLYTAINILSMLCYFFVFFGGDLPTVIIEPLNQFKNGDYTNHLFTLSYSDTVINSYFRYQAIFDEPGVVGSLSMLIIVMTNNRKGFFIPRLIALLSGIISFSFAFYILLIIYILYKSLFKIKHLTRFLCIVIALILIIVPNYDYLKNEIPMINKMDYRFSLLLAGSDKVSNRTSDIFESHFDEFINTKDIILGMGDGAASKVDPEGNSFKYYLYDNGLISFVAINLLLIFYCIVISNNKSDGLLVFIIISLFLLQRSNYVSLWFLILIITHTSISNKNTLKIPFVQKDCR
ncbi:hypothetical protein [Photobacterium damselae]|uniref:hypothetical protein n=1 Tax=Photobacterium damselae TaxID=38293 RepID=UPI0040692B47